MLSKLRVRLVLWTVVLEAILLLIFGALLVLVIQQTQNQRIDETLRLGASQLNAVVDVQAGRYIIQEADRTALTSQGTVAWILTSDGVVANTVGTDTAPPMLPTLTPPDQFSNGSLSQDEPARFFVTYLREGNQNLGTLVLALSLRNSQQLIQQILVSLGIAIPIVLLLSGAGGLFLANRALSPVAQITKTAQQITAADLSQRLDFELPNDEIGQLAATLNAMLDRLDGAFQRERQLTADVSHELRTPLGLLKTQLSLARSRPRENDALLQMMADMENDVDRMTRLAEQLLVLTRIEQQDSVLVTMPVDLKKLLNSVVERMQSQADERHVELLLAGFDAPSPQLDADPERLLQVFLNLLDNAIKYAGMNGRVTIYLEQDAESASVRISNTGGAIDPAHLPHLFERFYRVDSARARDTGGFGLGLAIADAIIKAHHGQIHVTSDAIHGTTFTVTLPILQNLQSNLQPPSLEPK